MTRTYSQRKVYFLGVKQKRTQKRVDKSGDIIFNETYGQYNQWELKEKSEKNGKSLRQACN